MVKRILLIFSIVMLILLDYAALDDITTGTEQYFFLEYAILVISPGIYLFLVYQLLKKNTE